MRISVSLIVNLVANGMTVDEIIAEYPDLEAEDIRQALKVPYSTYTDHPPAGAGGEAVQSYGAAQSPAKTPATYA